MKKEHSLLLALSEPENINGLKEETRLTLKPPIDWELIINLSEKHGTAPAVFKNLESVKGVPSSVLLRLKKVYLAVAHKNMKIYNALSQISKAFQRSGVDLIGLKGVHLAADVYKNIALRPMQDLDILIKKSDIPEARRIMNTLNFIQPQTKMTEAPRIFDHHLPPYFSSDKTFLVEIHYGIFMGGFASAKEINGLWDRALPVSLNKETLKVLSSEDLLIHMAFHLTYHHNFSFGLRGLIDISRSITRYKESLDWNKIVILAQKLDISLSMLASFRQVDEVFSVAPPKNILNQLRDDCSPGQLNRLKVEHASSFINAPFSKQSTPFSRLFWVRNRIKKLYLLISIAFPEPSVVAIQFGLKKSSPFILLFYLYRPVQILKTYLLGKGK